MGRNTIRIVIILATFSVLGILLMQFFFLKKTAGLNETRFHDLATQALKNVARHLIEYRDKTTGRTTNPGIVEVDQVSNNYYVVNVNDEINAVLLKHFLIKEFKKYNLSLDFEYAIYDCNSKKMVHGVSLKGKDDSLHHQPVGPAAKAGCDSDEEFFDDHYRAEKKKKCLLPTSKKYTYYFGVYFPNRSKYYSTNIHTWYVVNGILFIVILFFSYTLYLIVKQRRLSEVQKNFINNLTHEFRTPIASIDLSAKVLTDPAIIRQPERLEKYSAIIGEQTQRLSLQVEKVLQMASIEKQKLKLDKQEIELSGFLKKCADSFKSSQNDPLSRVTVKTPPEPVKIKADPFHLSNMIDNILDNAIKYCDEEPEITVLAERKKDAVHISFADNGIGIPRQYRKKIFDRFFRIPTGNIHNVKGFGLGLDYVKKITQLHGWKILVADHSPKGCIFTLIIPD
ncbi:MAG: HAMP domain-containing sensor histidine kinase [Mangrovibacterium sp.]|nr:HAMP domain-containing sensor histidine kinase [Mangrovibacterium sp.]